MSKYKCSNVACNETFTDFADCQGDVCNRCQEGVVEQDDSEEELGYNFYEDDFGDWDFDEEWEDLYE